jgi:hypothetical protein
MQFTNKAPPTVAAAVGHLQIDYCGMSKKIEEKNKGIG